METILYQKNGRNVCKTAWSPQQDNRTYGVYDKGEGNLGEVGYKVGCVAESFRCSPETIMTLLISHTPIQIKSFFEKKEQQGICRIDWNLKITKRV